MKVISALLITTLAVTVLVGCDKKDRQVEDSQSKSPRQVLEDHLKGSGKFKGHGVETYPNGGIGKAFFFWVDVRCQSLTCPYCDKSGYTRYEAVVEGQKISSFKRQ